MSRLLSLTILFTLVARTASAQTPAAPAPDDKSPGTALALSIGVTVAGAGMTFAGVESDSQALGLSGLAIATLGPTTGHWYAGDLFTWGLAARVVGAGVFAIGVGGLDFGIDAPSNTTNDNTTAAILMISGALLAGGGAAYDIVTAPRAVREHNARSAAAALGPTLLRDARGDAAPGLALVGSF
jgi:hypothetical protein